VGWECMLSPSHRCCSHEEIEVGASRSAINAF
jgi:hypothetical protein